jgi:biopolymer transport protein ExbB/TolQ
MGINDNMQNYLIIIVNITSITIICFMVCLCYRLIQRTRKLNKTIQELKQLEQIYNKMAGELLNMAESSIFQDGDGVSIFYKKLLDNYNQFMKIGENIEDD